VTGVPDGLVLAGGSGRRLGRPKAGIVIEGTTLVERAVAMLADRCGDVVVVSRADVALPPLEVRVVLDQQGPNGPMNALATGLGALTAEEVVVLACDLPLAAPVLARLLAVPAHAASVASDGARIQPLCARYPRARTLEVARWLMARGVFRMTELTAALDAVTVSAQAHELLNVNRTEDLDQVTRLLQEVTKPSGNLPGF
jgi:molybdopterin-guanine dinucleotide biosynthesis protein A